MNEEDEAFKEIEEAQGWRKRQIENKFDIDPYATKIRNAAIEEVARSVERFQGSFGPDTVASFAIYIRGLKR